MSGLGGTACRSGFVSTRGRDEGKGKGRLLSVAMSLSPSFPLTSSDPRVSFPRLYARSVEAEVSKSRSDDCLSRLFLLSKRDGGFVVRGVVRVRVGGRANNPFDGSG
jgi:hypothetical protein